MGDSLPLFFGVFVIIVITTLLFMYSIRLVMTSSPQDAKKVDPIPEEYE